MRSVIGQPGGGRVLGLAAVVALGLSGLYPGSAVAAAPTTLYAYAAAHPTQVSDCPQTTTAAVQCTLQEALLLATPGDTVALATAGSETSPATWYVGNYSVKLAGSTTAALTIEPAAGVARPILDGNNGDKSGCSTKSCAGAVFTLVKGTVNLDTVTIQHGADSGITTGGNLSLTGVTVTDNTGPVVGGIDDETNATGGFAALSVSDSTISDNSRGGLEVGCAKATVANSTFEANTAIYDGAAIAVGGCGSEHLTVVGSSFIDNQPCTPREPGACAYSVIDVKGGNSNPQSTIDPIVSVIRSTFDDYGHTPIYVSGSGEDRGAAKVTVGGDEFDGSCGPPVAGYPQKSIWHDGGYNIAPDDSDCFAGGIGDQAEAVLSIYLGEPGNYGGPTGTVPLLTGNAGIVAIPENVSVTTLDGKTYLLCPVHDQRGTPSPSATSCDAGAAELTAPMLTFTTTPPAEVAIGATYHVAVTSNPVVPVKVTAEGGCTLSGSTVTFTAGGFCTLVATSVAALPYVAAGFTSQYTSVLPAKPSAPRNLAAVVGNGTVSLTWHAPTSNGGGVITYEVYEGSAPGTENLHYPVNPTPIPHQVRSYVVAGQVNGVTVYFVVRAVDAAGAGPLSNEVAAKPHA